MLFDESTASLMFSDFLSSFDTVFVAQQPSQNDHCHVLSSETTYKAPLHPFEFSSFEAIADW